MSRGNKILLTYLYDGAKCVSLETKADHSEVDKKSFTIDYQNSFYFNTDHDKHSKVYTFKHKPRNTDTSV